MATSADQRLLELLEKWLTSLELHAKYASLDDASYQKIQPWPEHQRPSRWIIELARQKTLSLRSQLQERIQNGDVKFSDSLELMIFLANLVGSEHIERFIPIADASYAASLSPDSTVEQPIGTPEPTVEQPISAPEPTSAAATGTREMPTFVEDEERPTAAVGSARGARAERKSAEPERVAAPAGKPLATHAATRAGTPAATPEASPAPKPAAKAKATAAKTAGKPAAASKPVAAAAAGKTSENPRAEAPATYDRNGPSEAAREQVIADAARLVQWGRKWYELAELISSMSDRPHVTDVRRILKDNKSIIDKKAGRT